ncbi:pro-FMRFamide-related neuropeptide FF [Zonotrichia leucophrys gambelii]|uniref:pro-FMRFamide-related neuropeptide FF n=1 Tax=Zonotrichia leucophrys gambelii TaxID=257770 RepID=UPI0031402AEE
MAMAVAGCPVLLPLLLLLAGTPRSARACPGTPGPAPVSPGPAAPPAPVRGGCSGLGAPRGSRAAVSPAAPPPPGPPPAAAAAALGALLRSLRRPGRAPGAPRPRWGWGLQGGPQARLSPRSRDPPAAPFWTMATPQRFGRRR